LTEVLENLQKRLLKDNKNKRTDINELDFSEKSFIFLSEGVTDSLKKKKVMESIDSMANSQIGLSYDMNEVPECFMDIA
jgi:hypothetical protein